MTGVRLCSSDLILLRIIPNEIVLAVAALGLAHRIVCAIADPWSLLGALASFALTLGMFSMAMFIGKKRWKSRGVGAGDFKLAMIAAFIVGFPGIAYFYIALCVTMLVYFAYMITRGSFGFLVWFPMCSFLMISLLVGLIYSYIPGVGLPFGDTHDGFMKWVNQNGTELRAGLEKGLDGSREAILSAAKQAKSAIENALQPKNNFFHYCVINCGSWERRKVGIATGAGGSAASVGTVPGGTARASCPVGLCLIRWSGC